MECRCRTDEELTRRSVDDTKVTDHHALLPTGVKPLLFAKEEITLYEMIVARMLEAFSQKCIKDMTTIKAESCGEEFVAKGCVIRQPGWRGVLREKEEETVLPEWNEGRDSYYRMLADGRENQTQTAPHGSDPAGGYGNRRQGDRG